MREAKGGTGKWCPKCKEIRVVKATATVCRDYYPNQIRKLGGYTDSDPDIHYFLRGQECLACGHAWESAELARRELESLTRRADTLKEMVEAYVDAADQAGERLAAVRAVITHWDDSERVATEWLRSRRIGS